MNLPSHLKDPAQTKHQRLYDTVNSLIDFLEEKSDEPKGGASPSNKATKYCHCGLELESNGECPSIIIKPHWESDYAAMWDKHKSLYDDDRVSVENLRQDILELIRGLMK